MAITTRAEALLAWTYQLSGVVYFGRTHGGRGGEGACREGMP